jgi:hypothetical protein
VLPLRRTLNTNTHTHTHHRDAGLKFCHSVITRIVESIPPTVAEPRQPGFSMQGPNTASKKPLFRVTTDVSGTFRPVNSLGIFQELCHSTLHTATSLPSLGPTTVKGISLSLSHQYSNFKYSQIFPSPIIPPASDKLNPTCTYQPRSPS